MELKRILKQLMVNRGLKATELSRATGVANTTIANWLNGQAPRDVKQVKVIADYFSVTLDYLFFGIEPKAKTTFEEFKDEIDAGEFQVILKKINPTKKLNQ